jgi:hypothetical protein
LRSPFRSFHAVLLTLIGWLAYKLLQFAQDPEIRSAVGELGFGNQSAQYLPAAVALILWVLFYFSRPISDKLLEWMPLVRRFLAGRRHIEGDWPLVVVDCASGNLKYYGFLNIGFENGQYTVSGHDWHPDGRHALNFGSVQSYQSHPTLHYWYQQGERGLQRGYTFIEFFPRDRVPRRHTGVFHDPQHHDVRFYARKLRYKWYQSRLRDMEPRRLAAKAFADEVMPSMPKMIDTSVDVDWG